MTYRLDRAAYLTEAHADLFDDSRDSKLPVWAQWKLRDLRRLLLEEADNHSMSLAEIGRLMEGEK